MKPIEEFALMLLVGFVKAWRVQQVVDACAAGGFSLEEVHAHAPFISEQAWHRKTPVRAYVVQQWPKLGEWLLAHEHDPQALTKAIPEVTRLVADSNLRGVTITRKERTEVEREQRHYRASALGYARSRNAQKSHQRGAWNTVKK